MEIVLVLVVVVAIAAAAFVFLRGERRAGGGRGAGAQRPRLRGARRARVASRHDPMAVAVERHARAVEPGEAAVEERNLQAQARVVAADLHARQAGQPDPHAAQVDANRAYAEPDPYADPVQEDGHVYADPYAQPVDGRVYPAQAPDPDGVFPAQPPAVAAPPLPPPAPPRKRRFL
jgi:hypothetical protein